MMTRVTPFSSQPRTVFMSRTPPPSWIFMVSRGENPLDRLGVDGLAGEGAVEIDDVQIFEPLARRMPAPAREGRR